MSFKDRILASQSHQQHCEGASATARPSHYNQWNDTSMAKAVIAVEDGWLISPPPH